MTITGRGAQENTSNEVGSVSTAIFMFHDLWDRLADVHDVPPADIDDLIELEFVESGL